MYVWECGHLWMAYVYCVIDTPLTRTRMPLKGGKLLPLRFAVAAQSVQQRNSCPANCCDGLLLLLLCHKCRLNWVFTYLWTQNTHMYINTVMFVSIAYLPHNLLQLHATVLKGPSTKRKCWEGEVLVVWNQNNKNNNSVVIATCYSLP